MMNKNNKLLHFWLSMENLDLYHNEKHPYDISLFIKLPY